MVAPAASSSAQDRNRTSPGAPTRAVDAPARRTPQTAALHGVLRTLNLTRYAETFRDHDVVDLDAFLGLGLDRDLLKEMGLSVGARAKILRYINKTAPVGPHHHAAARARRLAHGPAPTFAPTETQICCPPSTDKIVDGLCIDSMQKQQNNTNQTQHNSTNTTMTSCRRDTPIVRIRVSKVVEHGRLANSLVWAPCPPGETITEDTIMSKCFNDEACLIKPLGEDFECIRDEPIVKEIKCRSDATQGCTIWCNYEKGYANESAACGACRPGYYRTTDKCRACPSAGVLALVLAVSVLAAYAGFFYKISHIQAGAPGPQGGGGDSTKQSNAYWRIVLSFFAINTALSQGIKTPLPMSFAAFVEYVTGVFDAGLFLVSPTTALMTCYDYHFSTHTHNYADRFIFTSFLPYAFVLSLGFGLWAYSFCFKVHYRDEADLSAKDEAAVVVDDGARKRKNVASMLSSLATSSSASVRKASAAIVATPSGPAAAAGTGADKKDGKRSKSSAAAHVTKATTISRKKKALAAGIWVLWLLYPRLLRHTLSLGDCFSLQSESIKGGWKDKKGLKDKKGDAQQYVYSDMSVKCYPYAYQHFRCSDDAFQCSYSNFLSCREQCLRAPNVTKVDSEGKKANATSANTWGFCVSDEYSHDGFFAGLRRMSRFDFSAEGWLDLGQDFCEKEGATWVVGDGNNYRFAWTFTAGFNILYQIVVPCLVLYVTTQPVETLHALQFKAVFGFLYKGNRLVTILQNTFFCLYS